MKSEYLYKPNVVDVTKRRRIIKENLKKKLSHKESFKIKNRWVACPIVLMDIDVPIYHLNNGRTRARQRSYIKENNHKDSYFEKGLENNQQQRIQHKILYDCLLYTSPSPRDKTVSRMPSSA